jgi:hypothetical protein
MNFAPVQYFENFCRRRPWFSATVFVFVFLNLVPTWPYTPTCHIKAWDDQIPIKGPMSADYRSVLKYGFAFDDLYYWDIGGVILIRLLPFVDNMGGVFHTDIKFSWNSKAAWVLATSKKSGSNLSFKLNGKIYKSSDLLDSVRDPKSGYMDYSHCKFMVPVVTGKPVSSSPNVK